MAQTFFSKIGAVIFLAAPLLIAWRALLSLLELSLHNDAYTYILLVIPICGMTLYLDRRAIQGIAARNPFAGSILLITSIGIALLTLIIPAASLRGDIQLSISILAVVVWWIGTFVFWHGIRAARIALFPLCLLFCIVPLPKFAMDGIVSFLQYGSAFAAHLLFSAVGVPALQNGNFITIPGLTLHVAEECSSIRSTTLLMLTTVELAHLFLRSQWRRLLIVASVIPLSIAKNGLRIWVIAMLGTRLDPGYLTGRLHRQGGIIYFILALLIIFVLLWLGRKGEARYLASSTA